MTTTKTDEEFEAEFWFTIKELAARWKVNPRTIDREVERGRLNKTIIGGQKRYSRAEVERYETQSSGTKKC